MRSRPGILGAVPEIAEQRPTRREPSALALITALVGLFLGSGIAGDLLARALAPGSFVAEVAGAFALPVAFAVSLQLWYGFALFTILPRVVGLLLGHRPAAGQRQVVSLPGAFLFLPCSVAAGVCAGMIVGLFATSFALAFLAFTTAGIVHGWIGWSLASRGVLIPPESV
jgi:hypothetical protein